MTIQKSILMMSNTGTNWEVTGDPVRGPAYYGYTGGVVTVQVVFKNLVGGFGIQATLATDPKPEDWFWIKMNDIGDIHTPYLQYPIDPINPTGQNGGDTGSSAFTFIGNFVFLRAVLTRGYIQPRPDPNTAVWQTWQFGEIDRVKMAL